MTSPLKALQPNHVAELLKNGHAVLIDIRETDEFARRHVGGARSQPLSSLTGEALKSDVRQSVIFTCRSGMRTAANSDRLAALVAGEAFVLEGGVDGWIAAGLPVVRNRRAPIEVMRQVQIAAGLLVLLGVALGLLISPAFLGLSAFVGVGLAVAGATGFCGMAKLLALMPWNRLASV